MNAALKPTIVHRHYFSTREVIAALFADPPACEVSEVLVDGDEVMISFVNPKAIGLSQTESKQASGHDAAAVDDGAPSRTAGSDLQEDVNPGMEEEEPPGEGPKRPTGPIEQEAIALCEDNLFRIFCKADGYDQAEEFILNKCHLNDLLLLDGGSAQKYGVSRFRDLKAEFDVWAMGE